MALATTAEQDLIRSLHADPDQHIVIQPNAEDRVLISRHGLRISLNRYLYQALRGPLNPLAFLLPTCDVQHCQNPYHYEASKVNRRPLAVCRNGHVYTEADVNPDGTRTCRACREARKARKRNGRPPNWAIEKAKTHCKYGHPFVRDNLYVYPTANGGVRRHCKTCTYARSRGEDPADAVYIPRS